MYHDLTKGNISRSLLLFALPMMAGNLLQQFYNIADTLIVGRVLGSTALAAVGSSYTLMTFLTSIFLGLSTVFSLVISALVFGFARSLMGIFIDSSETAVIACGVRYLRIEGAFYCGIGCLFLLYGYYRAVKQAGMSVVLTVISLGSRVALAYLLSAFIGEIGIWMAIPIGWGLADAAGLWVMHRQK